MTSHSVKVSSELWATVSSDLKKDADSWSPKSFLSQQELKSGRASQNCVSLSLSLSLLLSLTWTPFSFFFNGNLKTTGGGGETLQGRWVRIANCGSDVCDGFGPPSSSRLLRTLRLPPSDTSRQKHRFIRIIIKEEISHTPTKGGETLQGVAVRSRQQSRKTLAGV